VQQRRDRAADRRRCGATCCSLRARRGGADVSVSDPTSRQTVAQWAYKKRFYRSRAAAARDDLRDGLTRLGRATRAGRGRLVFNAGSWSAAMSRGSRPVQANRSRTKAANYRPVDLEDGDALVLFREVPPVGYLAVTEADRAARKQRVMGTRSMPRPGASASASIRKWRYSVVFGPDGKERVKVSGWSGLNQLVTRSAVSTARYGPPGTAMISRIRPQLSLTQAKLVKCRRERLPGIGVRLVVGSVARRISFDHLDCNTVRRAALDRHRESPRQDADACERSTLRRVPILITNPTVELEVPLGRMTVDRDQQPGSCRDWYCHTHWVWLREGADGLLWSAPDTPLFTLNDLVRGAWRPEHRPRRDAVRIRDEQLLAYELRRIAGGRLRRFASDCRCSRRVI